MTQSGIEPTTFRLVAQCLNELRHCVHYLLYNTPVINNPWLYQATDCEQLSLHSVIFVKFLICFLFVCVLLHEAVNISDSIALNV